MAIHATNKNTGDPLSAQEWNNLATDVNTLNAGVSTEVDPLDADKTIVKVGNVLVGELTAKGDKGTNVGVSGNNNINIEPRPALGDGSGKNKVTDANRKGGNIALKPGDDIEFWAHKRGSSKSDEVSVKTLTETFSGDEIPASLELNTSDIVITNKDKTSVVKITGISTSFSGTADATLETNAFDNIVVGQILSYSDIGDLVMNTQQGNIQLAVEQQIQMADLKLNKTLVYKVTSPTDNATKYYTIKKIQSSDNILNIDCLSSGEISEKAYVKLRAQAIDLRCEDHGGISLQPKGNDGQNHENKIKFEHGGGDGLEFGTFNTQHTSIYTGDYRFKKDGVIRLAERFTEVSDKADANDSTTAYKYLKNDSTNNAAKEAATGKNYESPDDFYDFIDTTDPTCTWNDIIVAVNYIKSQNPNLNWTPQS